MQKFILLCLVVLALACAVFAQEDILRDLSAAELRTLMPGLSEAKASQYVGDLNSAMKSAQINTPQRQSAFLAQLGHESGNLKWFKEFASGKAYEGRKDLGNTQVGDGTKFKGRGPIQITGRANYAAAGKALGVDLVKNPELAATPKVGFQTAAWFWNTRGLNKYADKGTQDSFDTITKRINGGFNGKADRDQKFRAAQKILNGNAPVASTQPTKPQVAQRPAQQTRPTQRPTQQTRPTRQSRPTQQTRPTRQQTRPSRQPVRQTRPSRQTRDIARPSRQTRPSRSTSSRPTRSSSSRQPVRQTRPSRSTSSRPTRSSYSRPTRSSSPSRSSSRSSYSRPTRSSSSRSSYSRPTRSSSSRSSYSRPTRSSYSRPTRSSSSRSSSSRSAPRPSSSRRR